MNGRLGSKFKGCYARDSLPNQLANGYYVLNLDNKNNPGTHWVGMLVSQCEMIYFDSFGFDCPVEILLRRGSRWLWYSSHEIQNVKSVACGYYVIYFLTEMAEGRDKNVILLDFNNNGSLDNDKVLKNLLLHK